MRPAVHMRPSNALSAARTDLIEKFTNKQGLLSSEQPELRHSELASYDDEAFRHKPKNTNGLKKVLQLI